MRFSTLLSVLALHFCFFACDAVTRTPRPTRTPTRTPTRMPTRTPSRSATRTPSSTASGTRPASATPSGTAFATGTASAPSRTSTPSAKSSPSSAATPQFSLARPIKAIYTDWKDVNWAQVDVTIRAIVDGGFNVVLLAFYLSGSGVVDVAQAWGALGSAKQSATAEYAHSKGAVLLVSAGGSTDSPYGGNASALGTTVGQWAVTNYLDGVDWDLENIDRGFVAAGRAGPDLVNWIISATIACRAAIGPARYLTHAPVAPYFGPTGGEVGNAWPGPSGGYTAVWEGVPAGTINWFSVQFYNQGTCYGTQTSLFYASNGDGSCPAFPGTSLAEISAYGVPKSALVVGKPVDTSDAGSGWIAAAELHTWVTAAGGSPLLWSTGVMGWSWNAYNAASWIATIYP